MRELNDPANPYAGQYEEWDIWLYEHGVDFDTPVPKWDSDNEQPANWVFEKTRVTPDGYPVPLSVDYQLTLNLYNDRYNPDPLCVCPYWFNGQGMMPDAMQERLLLGQLRLRSAMLPLIPVWLAAQPPRFALQVPSGEWVVLGELGAGTNFKGILWQGLVRIEGSDELLGWNAYRHDGELLVSGEPGDYWWQLFWPDFEEVVARQQVEFEDAVWRSNNGYVYFVENNKRGAKKVSFFNYDGSPRPLDHKPGDREGLPLKGIQGADLQMIFAYQQMAKSQ